MIGAELNSINPIIEQNGCIERDVIAIYQSMQWRNSRLNAENAWFVMVCTDRRSIVSCNPSMARAVLPYGLIKIIST